MKWKKGVSGSLLTGTGKNHICFSLNRNITPMAKLFISFTRFHFQSRKRVKFFIKNVQSSHRIFYHLLPKNSLYCTSIMDGTKRNFVLYKSFYLTKLKRFKILLLYCTKFETSYLTIQSKKYCRIADCLTREKFHY